MPSPSQKAMLLELHAVSSAKASAYSSGHAVASASQVEQLQLMLEAFMNADASQDTAKTASRFA